MTYLLFYIEATSMIGIIGVFLLFLIFLYLILMAIRNNSRSRNLIFGGFLLVVAFDFSGLFLGDLYRSYRVINSLQLCTALIQMPLLHLYLKKTLYSNHQLYCRHFWELVPAAATFFTFQFIGDGHSIELIYVFVQQLQFYIYVYLIIKEIVRFKRLHRNIYSEENAIVDWLLLASIFLLLTHSTVLLKGVFEWLYNFEPFPTLDIVVAFSGLLTISWTVLQVMLKPTLFTKVLYERSKSGYSSQFQLRDFEEDLERLEGYVLENKPYLEEKITLPQLALLVGIPQKRLSQLINERYQRHFFDYINFHRIEEAQNLLIDSNLTIQQIMYRVGFNSKSSFNTAFKKETSFTPSAFRKEKHHKKGSIISKSNN